MNFEEQEFFMLQIIFAFFMPIFCVLVAHIISYPDEGADLLFFRKVENATCVILGVLFWVTLPVVPGIALYAFIH